MSDRFPIVFAIFPRITQLDFTGPYEVLHRIPGAEAILASFDGRDVIADGGLTFTNVKRLSDVDDASLLCVPGGYGTLAAMEDRQFLSEIRRLASKAKHLTSVCTGSLLLGAAGLLKGKRAACHWAWRDLLTHFGAIPDEARVVRDGNVFTGGGVTAGVDMALTVVSEIIGKDHAQAIQLAIEYAPAPPFDCGRPELASPEILARVRRRLDATAGERVPAVLRAAAAARIVTR
jgi:cyclohexyl-isocyanide hydratase